MSRLTADRLRELTALINSRLNEFDGLFNPLSRGYVRLVHDVIEEFNSEFSEVVHEQRDAVAQGKIEAANQTVDEGEAIVTASDFPQTPAAPDLNIPAEPPVQDAVDQPVEPSSEMIGDTTSEPPSAATSADVELDDDEIAARTMSGEQYTTLLDEVVQELRSMADDERMPTMDEWDTKRSPGMLTAQSITKRLGLPWNDIAFYARLRPNRTEGQ